MRYFKLVFVMLPVIACVAVPTFSQEGDFPKQAILDEMIQEAWENNPAAQAAEMRWKAALEKIPQVKALPDPVLSYGHFFKSIETRLGPQRNKLSLSQRFPFFGKLSLKEQIALEQAAVLEEQILQIRQDISLKVKEAYHSLSWFDEAVQIGLTEKEVLQRLADVARRKYEVGSASQQDYLKAQLEITRVTDKLLSLKQGRHAAVAQLNALLSRPADSMIETVEKPVFIPLQVIPEVLTEWAAAERPELRATQQLIKKNGLDLDLAKKNYWPDFNVMVDYFDIGGGTTTHPQDGRNAWMASIGINIPLWRGKLKAAETEAAIQLKANQNVLKSLQNDTAAKIRELYHEIKMYDEQISLYRHSLVPQAEQSLKASEIGYVAGTVDFLNFLDAERMLLQLKTGYAKLLADRGKSLARLERVVGRDLNIYPETHKMVFTSQGEQDSAGETSVLTDYDKKDDLKREGSHETHP
jgi:outer membrane protein TolC